MNDQLVSVVFTPSGKRGEFPIGKSVLSVARELGVDLESVCGGRGICGRCQIEPSFGSFAKLSIDCDESSISPFNQVEARYKRVKGMKDGRRLGCQCIVQSSIVVDVPEESQMHRQVIRKAITDKPMTVDPLVHAYYIEVEQPDMHKPSGDLERVLSALKEQWSLDVVYDYQILSRLQKTLRDNNWQVTCVIENHQGANRLIAVLGGFVDRLYGLAFDVGSTTISCNLVCLNDGAVLASMGAMNPQIRFGEDLMSRVSFVMMNQDGVKDLTQAVRETLKNLAHNAIEAANIDKSHIFQAVLVGNPVMHHLFLGISPIELGWAPFALATNGAVYLPSSALDLPIDGNAYILPCIAGHVGADCAAVVLSEKPYQSDRVVLLVDVGTNAEIVLGNKERLLACSSPTGPAFEGAQISCGQRAAPGAIERVRIDPETLEPRFKVIGSDFWSNDEQFAELIANIGVTGICGSGIIEIIAEMMLVGIIGNDGLMNSKIAERTHRMVADGRTFSYLVYDGNPQILVSQNDIRAIQLAKAALYAGCQLLIDKLGRRPDYIGLAGAFGSHIDTKYALMLGMIPDCDLKNVESVGNAAGTGARMALLSQTLRHEIEKTVRAIEKIETAIEPKFQEYFVGAMGIPHATDHFPNLSSVVTLPERVVKESSGAEEEDAMFKDFIANATIEVTPNGAKKVENFAQYLPAGARVFITFLPGSDIADTIETAVRLRKEGMKPIPHLAARFIPNQQFFESALKKLTEQAGVDTCLLIGGGVAKPVGDYHETAQLLKTGMIEKMGIKHVFIAGHPEGSPDFPDKAHWDALAFKQNYMNQTGVKCEITTQFCFAAEPIFEYAKRLRDNGITMDFRVGIPGLATLKTLITHATQCGIGPSLKILTREAANLSKLLLVREPTELCQAIVDGVAHNPNIKGFHMYPLGGFVKTAEYMRRMAG